MDRSLTRAIFLGLAGLALTTGFGCGSGTSPTSDLPPGVPQIDLSQSSRVSGRLFLGSEVGPALITVKDLQNQTIAQTMSSKGGYFLLGSNLPQDFRVTARIATLEFATEVRGYSGGPREVVINVPTTLASRLAGGSDLGTAEARVRSILKLPPQADLEHGIEESGRSPFSHLRYLVEASKGGGWEAFTQQLLASSAPHPFLLDAKTLRDPLTNLDPALLATVNRMRADRRIKRSVLGAESVLGGLAADFGKFVGEGVASSVLDAGIDSVWTWTAQQMGLNFGTGVELEEILDQLGEIQNTLNDIQIALAETTFTQAVSDLNTDDVVPLNTLTNTTFDAAGEIGYQSGVPNSLSLTNKPSLTGSSAQLLIGQLSQYKVDAILADLQTNLLGLNGSYNILAGSNSLFALDTGFDAQSKFFNFPLRSNFVVDRGADVFNRYAGYQNVAANFLAENIHGSSQLAADINTTFAQIQSAGASIRRQRQYLPAYLPSEDVLVDLENGIMWYLPIADPETLSQARTNANNKTVAVNGVTYSDWRLPSYNECVALQERGRFVSNTTQVENEPVNVTIPIYSNQGDGDTGQSLRGLASLGFHSATWEDFSTNADLWYDDWYVKPKDANNFVQPWQRSDDITYFHLNRLNDNTSTTSNGDTKHHYILCRTLGTTSVLVPGKLLGIGNGFGGTTVGSPETPVPTTWSLTPLQDAEFPALAAPTGISSLTLSGGKVVAAVDYLVSLGGQHTSKQGSQSAITTTNTTAAYSRTLNSTSTAYQVLPAFTSAQNSPFVVSNLPAEFGKLLVQTAQAQSSLTETVTATLELVYNPQGVLQPASLTTSLSVSNVPAPTLKAIQIMPRNRIYTANTSEQYQVVAFYSDFRTTDVTASPTTLTIVNNADGKAVSGANISVAGNNSFVNVDLTALQAASVSTLNVTATSNGKSDSTLIGIPVVVTP